MYKIAVGNNEVRQVACDYGDIPRWGTSPEKIVEFDTKEEMLQEILRLKEFFGNFK